MSLVFENNYNENQYLLSDGSNNSIKQIVRKGDIIYYAKNENIWHAFQKSNEATQQKIKESSVDMNNVFDTGSSFKTFTFDELSNDMETDKCIAFWKTVTERKLEPIKSNLIRYNSNCNSETNTEAKIESSNKTKDAVKQATDAVNAEYRKIWKNIIKEMQAEKLESIKMNIKARCQKCDLFEVEALQCFEKDLVKDTTTDASPPQKTPVRISDRKVKTRLFFDKRSDTEIDKQLKKLDTFKEESIEELRASGGITEIITLSEDTETKTVDDGTVENIDVEDLESSFKQEHSELKPQEAASDLTSVVPEHLKTSSMEEVRIKGSVELYRTKRGSILQDNSEPSLIEIHAPKLSSSEDICQSGVKSSLCYVIAENTAVNRLQKIPSNVEATRSTRLNRGVSLLLPTGEIETAERDDVSTLSWVMPDSAIRNRGSLTGAVPSLELLRQKSIKSVQSFNMKEQSTSKSGSKKIFKKNSNKGHSSGHTFKGSLHKHHLVQTSLDELTDETIIQKHTFSDKMSKTSSKELDKQQLEKLDSSKNVEINETESVTDDLERKTEESKETSLTKVRSTDSPTLTRLGRGVSLLLPTGIIEMAERDDVSTLSWVMPDSATRDRGSLRGTVPSLELLRNKSVKSVESLNIKQQSTSKSGSKKWFKKSTNKEYSSEYAFKDSLEKHHLN